MIFWILDLYARMLWTDNMIVYDFVVACDSVGYDQVVGHGTQKVMFDRPPVNQ